jgi:hypothetical protein
MKNKTLCYDKHSNSLWHVEKFQGMKNEKRSNCFTQYGWSKQP